MDRISLIAASWERNPVDKSARLSPDDELDVILEGDDEDDDGAGTMLAIGSEGDPMEPSVLLEDEPDCDTEPDEDESDVGDEDEDGPEEDVEDDDEVDPDDDAAELADVIPVIGLIPSRIP